MATQTIERSPVLTEREVKFTTPYLKPEPKNGILGRIARTKAAFNDWRHQDLFDIIFSDFFFENTGRGFAAASRDH